MVPAADLDSKPYRLRRCRVDLPAISSSSPATSSSSPTTSSSSYLRLRGSARPEGEAGELGGGEGGGAVVGAPPEGSSPMVITID